MRGLFFTGTDTGVGKTVVTAVVARALRAAGRIVRVSKPVATGSEGVAEDTRLLADACGETDWKAITPWTFAAPAAPPVAARAAGTSLSLAEVVEAVRGRSVADGIVLVEGTGGLLCPLTERKTVADLAGELGLALVVVARQALGTLNHTLLTVEVAASRGLPVAGVVVSETEPPRGLADETNVEELRRRLEVPILAVVPHTRDDARLAGAVAGVDWWELGRDRAETRGRAWRP